MNKPTLEELYELEATNPPLIGRGGGSKLDKAGAVLSSACAIHCIAMPLVLTSLPLIGLGFLADHAFESWVLLTMVIIASLAAWKGHAKHGKWRVTATFMFAIFVMVVAHFTHDHEHADDHFFGAVMMPLGGILTAIGHIWNAHHIKEAHCECEGH